MAFIIWRLRNTEVKRHTFLQKHFSGYLRPGYIFISNSLQEAVVKGTVIQIEKALINARLCASKVSLKFHIPTIYNFVVI